METERVDGGSMPTFKTRRRLMDVDCGCRIVHGQAVIGKDDGKVEELVEVTLCRERNHHNAYDPLCLPPCILQKVLV